MTNATRLKLKQLRVLTIISLCCQLSACSYLQATFKQTEYLRIQKTNPSQRNLKHIFDRETYFVYGRVLSESNQIPTQTIAVAAYSDRFKDRELVDVANMAHADTHYGLNLPDGVFDLLVLVDQNQSGSFDASEVVGQRQITLTHDDYPEKVIGNVDISLSQSSSKFAYADWNINISTPVASPQQESLFYPKGTIRSLSDPMFGKDVATLGMYDPAEFQHTVATMFYALEEDSYKIPVLFVHGIGGSPREFEAMVKHLDTQRYMPWFFYYPSGSDLDQLSKLFYKIFLSGNVIPLDQKPIVIIAHSMGGLVVRDSINRLQGSSRENQLKLMITIATPFGGHPRATSATKYAPLVLPSWRDLDPKGGFMKSLFRNPLPAQLEHQLLYAYDNTDKRKFGENSDGVIPLSSQLNPTAWKQSSSQVGFNSNHTDVLQDEDVIDHVIKSINSVKGFLPESHIKILSEGGFSGELDGRYSDREKHVVRTRANYMLALTTGMLDHLHHPVLEHFVDVAQGKAKPETDAELAWQKFIHNYPRFGE